METYEKTNEGESLKLKESKRRALKLQEYVYSSLPNKTPQLLAGENPKAINGFLEKNASRLGPDAKDITEEETREMYDEYANLCKEAGVEVTDLEKIIEETTKERQIAESLRKYVYNVLPHIASKLTVASPEEKRKLDDFMKKYSNNLGTENSELSALGAQEMYDEFRLMIADHYDTLDTEEIINRN